jgi:hypothetical protein
MSDRLMTLAAANLRMRVGGAAAAKLRSVATPAPLDLLLLLYTSRKEAPVRRREAAARCGVSEAIVERWIEILAQLRLASRPASDGPITLTDSGCRTLEIMLKAAAQPG